MVTTFIERFRMERDPLRDLGRYDLPAGYTWAAWDEALVTSHATTVHAAFRNTLDAQLFPNLTDLAAGTGLLLAIAATEGFCPAASWLVCDGRGPAGAIQGIVGGRWGAIQNVAVRHEHRGRGLGEALVNRALHGFADAGASAAYLDVTARNAAAVRLYRRLGFAVRKKCFSALVADEPAGAGL